jgi:hypothetical protein
MREGRGSSGVYSRRAHLLLSVYEFSPLDDNVGHANESWKEDMQDRSHSNAGPLQAGSSIRVLSKAMIRSQAQALARCACTLARYPHQLRLANAERSVSAHLSSCRLVLTRTIHDYLDPTCSRW